MDESSSIVTLELPWPPSTNTYWRRKGSRYFISQKGQSFRNQVSILCKSFENKFNSIIKLSIKIDAFPPDKRKRDLDNILKSLFDSLQHAGVYFDDYQISEIHVIRHTPLDGKVIVTISEYNQNGTSESMKSDS